MATQVVMEALSPTMEEGRLIRWLRKEGDAVKTGDTLAEVETDKAVMELVARTNGVLRKIIASEGATIEVGKPVAVIGTAEEDVSALAADKGRGKGEEGTVQQHSARPPSPSPFPVPTSPAAAPSPSPLPSSPVVAAGGRVRSSPLARKLAGERGVDLALMHGSGPGGRVVKRDLEGASVSATALPSHPPTLPPSGTGAGEGYRDVPLTQIRKTIARRLAQSMGPIPHFFLTSEIDMERVADARDGLNRLDPNSRISFNDIVIKVVAAALVRHPECNAWWQEDRIRYFDEVHIGMAVAIDDGLITPVIRNAHRKSMREISAESRDLAARARARKLRPEEYTGSTFSLSNLGMLDIEQFTAVINPPEAGILAVGSITPRPVAVDGNVVVRRRMHVTMSCDHRVIDGATGARFLQTVKRMLENPLAMVW